MPNYSQRFKRYHTYYANVAEDFLAVTICLPFTFALYCWNSIADLITEIPFIPNNTDAYFWNVGKFIFTLPLYTLKGLLGLTIIPLIAANSARNNTLPPRSNYIFTQIFQMLSLSGFVRLMVAIFTADAFADLLVFLSFGLLSSNSPLMQNIGLMLLNVNYGANMLFTFYPYFHPFLSFALTMSQPLMLGLGFIAALAWLQGKFGTLSMLAAKMLNVSITFVQHQLLKRGKMTFNNTEDVVSMEAIKDIDINKIFVTNSNYAINLESLEDGVQLNGLVNYNHPKDNHAKHPPFDLDDVLRLEKVATTNQYPQLAKFIHEHKNEYNPTIKSSISEKSLNLLRNLANSLEITQARESFAHELVAAKAAFEDHLNQITPNERKLIEELNLLGGMDNDYQLKNVLTRVFGGKFCKKGASRLIIEAIERENKSQEEENVSLFYQRNAPTHWMGIHFRIR
ncbi:MAG: hypothetical protein JSS07_03550 [Proteobacteria bacterium]|nr:hypothetical protein [Pseudomonadota bacterium]